MAEYEQKTQYLYLKSVVFFADYASILLKKKGRMKMKKTISIVAGVILLRLQLWNIKL